jgi:hypothetical protein
MKYLCLQVVAEERNLVASSEVVTEEEGTRKYLK